MLHVLAILAALLLSCAGASADSFTFWGRVSSSSTYDFTISWPWTNHMASYVAACGGTCADAGRLGAGVSPGPEECFYITRATAWLSDTTKPVMIGKLDVNGTGGDYITPAQTLYVSDSGWFPPDARPLFKPGDELHIHTTGPGTVALATIFFLKVPCP